MDAPASPQYDLNPASLQRILPEAPGVYFFKGASGRIIYVGKAKSLKKRVLSYFRPGSDLPYKTALMMKQARGIDFILTSTEKEALILEDNLVKKHLPRYNIILRDDKRYPCLRLDITQPYPRLEIARRIKKDGAIYFGPFSSAQAVRSTLKVIDRVFQLRKCKSKRLPRRTRPCLNYQLDRCLGVCVNRVPEQKYREIVQQVRLFLEGRNRELIRQLQRHMTEAAERMEFERAARIRDRIHAIERTLERQHVVSPLMEDQDVIGLARVGDRHQLVILFIRKGALVGSRSFLFREPNASPSEVLEAFLKQYYSREAFVPREILISDPVEDLEAIALWLTDLAGRKVVVHRPLRGKKTKLVKMAIENARSFQARGEEPKEELAALAQRVLRLKKVPRRIEGMDISNLQGRQAVGTIVAFVEGRPHKSGYRNYRMKETGAADDYAMMEELVSRRMSKGDLPDLFVVDGGKGHLSAVKSVVERLGGPDAPEVISIAKAGEGQDRRLDRIYLPGRKNPVALGQSHPVLLLMMRIRDEAHRRAVTYHRKLRGKGLTQSPLDRIPGIGPKRKQALLAHFKSLEAVAGASIEELARVPGLTKSVAREVYSHFRGRDA